MAQLAQAEASAPSEIAVASDQGSTYLRPWLFFALIAALVLSVGFNVVLLALR
jgi:hypothetical protein